MLLRVCESWRESSQNYYAVVAKRHRYITISLEMACKGVGIEKCHRSRRSETFPLNGKRLLSVLAWHQATAHIVTTL